MMKPVANVDTEVKSLLELKYFTSVWKTQIQYF